MAFVGNLEEENKQKALSTAPAKTSSVGSEATGGDSGGAGPSDGDGKGSGTGWTNLSTYIDANKGNDGTMAGKITSDSQGSINEATDKVNKWNTDTSSNIKSGTTEAYGGTGKLNQMDQSEFDKYYKADYGGPKSAEAGSGWQGARQGSRTSQQLADSTDTFQGTQGLLRDSFGRDDYNQGMNTLDTFLVRGGEQGKQAMQGIRDQNEAFQQDLENKKAGLNQQINQAVDTTDRTRTAFQGMVDKEYKGYDDQIQDAIGRIEGRETPVSQYESAFNRPSPGYESEYYSQVKGQRNSDELRALKDLMGEDTQDMYKFDPESAQRVISDAPAPAPVKTDYQDLIGSLGTESNYVPPAPTAAPTAAPAPEASTADAQDALYKALEGQPTSGPETTDPMQALYDALNR